MIFRCNKQALSCGSSVVVAVWSLPILFIFLCAMVDLGRVVYLGSEANAAAHAVRSYINRQDQTCSDKQACSIAQSARPALQAPDVCVTVAVRKGKLQTTNYIRKYKDGVTAAEHQQNASVQTQAFEVALTLTGSYLTPIGWLFDASNQHAFTCIGHAQGTLDAQAEGGQS